jgi:hypothetical protein
MKFLELYSIPGEGLVAAFESLGETLLFDKQGLQSRILTLRHQGNDSSEEELALTRMSAALSSKQGQLY